MGMHMNHRILPPGGKFGLLLALFALTLSGCTQTKLVDSWQADPPRPPAPDKVAVIVALPDALTRQAVEMTVVEALNKKGANAVAASRLPGMTTGIRGVISEERAGHLLRRANVDGVIIVLYAGAGETSEYVRSDYWAQYLGSGVGWGGYRWGQPYFTSVYTIRQGPGWADTRNRVYVESSYYDMDAAQPVWRIVTQTKDTEHADTAADVSKKIVSQMRSAKLM
jgi:hypothetical protein